MMKPLPCPFCGSTDISMCGMSRALGGFWVECQSGTCWAEGPRGADEPDAVAAWNKAPREAQPDHLAERLRNARRRGRRVLARRRSR